MARNQIDSFMNAIAGVESGGASDPYNVENKSTGAHGRWQIMPNNWEPWSKETFGRVVSKTPENQFQVARNKMLEYYDQFNDWDAVAVAWFAGPGRAQKFQSGDRSVLGMSDGYSTVQEYLGKLNKNMNRDEMGPGGPPSSRRGGGPDSLTDYNSQPNQRASASRSSYPTPSWDDLPVETSGQRQQFDNIAGSLTRYGEDFGEEKDFRTKLLDIFTRMADRQAGGRHLPMDQALAGAEVPDEDIFSGADFMRANRSIDDRIDMASSAVSEITKQTQSQYESTANAMSMGRRAAMRQIQRAASQDGDLGVPETAGLDVDARPLAVPESYDEGRALLDIASQYKGVPYKWGGTNPNRGLDCSGLVQLAGKQLGIDLPRVSRQQARVGKEVGSLKDAIPGDLVAFSSRGKEVGHIGIYAGNGKMLHAPRSGTNVRIDPIGDRKPVTIRRITGGNV